MIKDMQLSAQASQDRPRASGPSPSNAGVTDAVLVSPENYYHLSMNIFTIVEQCLQSFNLWSLDFYL